MTVNNIDLLKQHIRSMQSQVESQKQLYNRSLECLEQTKASLAVTKIVKRANGQALTPEEQAMHDSLIKEAYENVSKQIYAIAEMESELRNMENELLFKE